MEKYYSVSKMSGYRSVTVEKAALYFSVSTRRIRKLLADGRLAGVKSGKLWHVTYPYQYTIGTRGPQLVYRQLNDIKIRPYKPKRKRND